MENEWENINTLLWCGKIGPIPVGAVVYPFPFMNIVEASCFMFVLNMYIPSCIHSSTPNSVSKNIIHSFAKQIVRMSKIIVEELIGRNPVNLNKMPDQTK